MRGPFEILELGDGETLVTRIEGYETGKIEIYPERAPEGMVITALRIHVPEEDKAYFPWYWDVTSRTLKSQLFPILEAGGFEGRTFKITKQSRLPRAEFTLQIA